MRCLLVDDEPGIREGLAMLLRRRGHEVHTAGDCAAASGLLASTDFDVVVTDWRLPDGFARTFTEGIEVPVVAMSGHPEQVVRAPNTRAVLSKPVRPAVLLPLLDELAVAAEPEGENAEPRFAPDVQRVVQDTLAQLPADLSVTCEDDGTFVVLRVALPHGFVPMVRPLGGDLRVLDGHDGRELELRLCRDGSPDLATPVVAFDAPWPATGPVALDCRDVSLTAEQFARRLDCVAESDAGAGRFCLVNVPDHLESVTDGFEAAHEMPMRTPVGPRLSAELAELWS